MSITCTHCNHAERRIARLERIVARLVDEGPGASFAGSIVRDAKGGARVELRPTVAAVREALRLIGGER